MRYSKLSSLIKLKNIYFYNMNFMGNRPSNIRVILQKFYVNKPT